MKPYHSSYNTVHPLLYLPNRGSQYEEAFFHPIVANDRHDRRENRYILTATCPGAPGQVAAISGFLAERDCYILEMAQFDDLISQRSSGASK